MAHQVKNLPAMQATLHCSGDSGSIPGWGRSPEEGMATHSRIPAWRIPWTEEPGKLRSPKGRRRIKHD